MRLALRFCALVIVVSMSAAKVLAGPSPSVTTATVSATATATATTGTMSVAAAAETSGTADRDRMSTACVVIAGGRDLTITSATKTFAKGWRGELQKIAAAHRGDFGLAFINLKTGEEFLVNGNEPFPTASTIKVPVMCAVFAEFDRPGGPFKTYYDKRTFTSATIASGAGFIQSFNVGKKLELKELVHLMITVSDNIGTNMLTEWIGIDTVNEWLVQNGFEVTRMNATIGSKWLACAEGRKTWGLGQTTPREMARLVAMIWQGKAGTPASTDEMLRVMSHQYFDDNIASEVPPGVWVGSKSGAVNRSRSDVAIVNSPGGAYVLAVFTKNNVSQTWDKTNEGEIAIAKASRIVYRAMNPKSKWVPPAGAEKF